ncbi:MAG: signal peptidase I [Roseibacillus sp.]
MSEQATPTTELGAIKPRSPKTAFNLSNLSPGLGQIYCGCLNRGLLHIAFFSLVFIVGIVLLAMELGDALILSIVIIILLTAFSFYSAFDARKLARQCREDYRLKEYNSGSFYLAISIVIIALIVGFTFTLRENFIQGFRMTGNSMNNTLTEGQRIVVRKDAYLRDNPERYDLIAFRNPDKRSQTWVKRVIGLPGDVVEIKAGEVWVNGAAIKESPSVRRGSADLPPTTVPQYHCYVLGDNRAHSKDSRNIGPIPMIALVGEVVGHP